MNTNINLTAAIRNGLIDFDKALELQGITMTAAIREGILTFEEACALQGLTSTAEATTMPETGKIEKPAPKKQAKKATPKKQAKKAEKPEEPKGFSYSKGGAIIQHPDHHTLKANNLRRVNNAVRKLTEEGFDVTWKRVGSWMYVFQTGEEKRPSKEYKAVKLAEGWKNIKGAWVDNTMLADYEDNFRK